MLDRLLDLLRDTEDETQISTELAAAAVLFEVVWADHDVDPAEIQAVAAALREQFALSANQVDDILHQTQANHEQSVGVFGFTRVLNEQLDQQEKAEIIGAMWRIAYADNTVDALEEHTIRRIADLLYVPHKTFIAAKHAARDDR